VTTAALIRSDVRVFRATDADIAGPWGRAIGETSEAGLAHAPEWFTVIRSAYGHDPLYLSAEDGDGCRGVLPAFVVRRPVRGTVVSSMPFLDGGGPCSSSAALEDALVARVIEEARRLGAGAVEIRSGRRLGIAAEPMEHKVNLVLPLPPDATRLWQQFDGRVRNQVRKAERSGLSVEFGGAERLGDFYAIFATRMRELGSPVHAQRFFRAVFGAFGGRARVGVVRQGTTPIGSLIALAFKDTLVVPWASCLRRYVALCPNMLLYWETMRLGCAEGFRRFDFGRSTRDSGTYRFKRQWGAQEEPLFWYTIPLRGRGRGTRPGARRGAALLTGSWRHLPLALTRSLGPHIRKYLTE
jgi:serine/alanine adding enzyme